MGVHYSKNGIIRALIDYSIFYIPVLVIYSVFFIFPVISAFYYAMTDWSGIGDFKFTGLKNFKDLLNDSTIKQAFIQTLEYTVIIAVIQNFFGLMISLILEKSLWISGIAKSVLFLPYVLNVLVVGFVWTYIYNPIGGTLNDALSAIGLEKLTQIWIGDPKWVIPAIAFTVVWQFTGVTAILYLAGLKSIPVEFYEAAAIDGASPFQKMRYVTLPLLAPAITLNVVFSFIGCMKIFDIIYVMSSGGPGTSSESVTSLIYTYAFTRNSFGYATSMGVVLFLIIAVLSLLMITFLRKREVEL